MNNFPFFAHIFARLDKINFTIHDLDKICSTNGVKAEQELHHLVHHLDLGSHDIDGTIPHPHNSQLHHLYKPETGDEEHQGVDCLLNLTKGK